MGRGGRGEGGLHRGRGVGRVNRGGGGGLNREVEGWVG